MNSACRLVEARLGYFDEFRFESNAFIIQYDHVGDVHNIYPANRCVEAVTVIAFSRQYGCRVQLQTYFHTFT